MTPPTSFRSTSSTSLLSSSSSSSTAMLHKQINKSYSLQYKLSFIQPVIQNSITARQAAINNNLNYSMVFKWVKSHHIINQSLSSSNSSSSHSLSNNNNNNSKRFRLRKGQRMIGGGRKNIAVQQPVPFSEERSQKVCQYFFRSFVRSFVRS